MMDLSAMQPNMANSQSPNIPKIDQINSMPTFGSSPSSPNLPDTNAISDPTKVPSLQSNMFKMQRNKSKHPRNFPVLEHKNTKRFLPNFFI